MKRIGVGIVGIVWLFAQSVWAQPFGNEWIIPGQRYVKIPVVTSGLYRVGRATLDSAGVPASSIPAKGYQLFARGIEQPLVVSGDPNGPLGNSDYIEFFGIGYQGDWDREFYPNPAWHSNPFAPLHNDTLWYYLTWTFTGNGLRMAAGPGNNTSAPLLNTAWSDSLYAFRNQYCRGQGKGDGGSIIHHSYFDLGEGWTGGSSAGAHFLRFRGLSDFDASAGSPQWEGLLQGRNARQHAVEVGYSATTGAQASYSVVGSTTFRAYAFGRVSGTLPTTFLNASQTEVTFRMRPTLTNDAVSVSWFRLSYPRFLNARGRTAYYEYVFRNTSAYNRFRLLLPDANTRIFDISDGLRPQELQRFNQTATDFISAFSGNSTGTSRLAFVSRPIPILARNIRSNVQFRALDGNTANYVVVTHPAVRSLAGVGDPVRSLAQYRASAAGGGYDTLILNMPLLADQFNYGTYDPRAIRNLLRYLSRNDRQKKHLCLVGNGIQLDNRANTPATYFALNQVPSWGVPASDAIISAGILDPGAESDWYTGRIAARTANDVNIYLQKLIEHESQPFELWRKNFLFLSGGRVEANSDEPEEFKSYSESYINTIQGPLMGARSKLFVRRQSSFVETVNIVDDVNAGVGFINIFGHSSRQGADIDIQDPGTERYNNPGRYPMIAINGCYAGDLYSYSTGTNYRWIFAQRKGAVAFLGNVDEAYPFLLDKYLRNFFRVSYTDDTTFGRPMGEILRFATMGVLGGTPSPLDTILVDQFTLHGDPALRLFGAAKSDYKTSDAEVFMADPNVNLATNSFRLGVVVSNVGRYTEDTLTVNVRRLLPDGTEANYGPFSFPTVKYRDTLYVPITRAGANIGGLHRFEVRLDQYGRIDEMDETNNVGTLDYSMASAGIALIAPKKYAIVNTRTVSFVAEASSLNAGQQAYVIEIDTSARFTSPIKQTTVFQGGNIPIANLILPLSTDSVVYHWRIAFQNQPTLADTGTFIYLTNGREGWNQSTFDQFSESTLSVLEKNTTTRRWFLPVRNLDIELRTSGANISAINDNNFFAINVNGTRYILSFTNSCWLGSSGQMLAMRFDRNSLEPYPYELWKQANSPRYWDFMCGREPMLINRFISATMDRIQNFNILDNYRNFVAQYIRDSKDGDFVMFINSGLVTYQNWHYNTKRELANIGADTTRYFNRLQPGHPWAIIGQKGNAAGTANEAIADPNSPTPPEAQTISLSRRITGQTKLGTITSTRIGPASTWQTLFFDVRSEGSSAGERWSIDLIGSPLQGNDTVLMRGMTSSPVNLNGVIDPVRYPYIYLRATLQDSLENRPPQIRYWRVTYDGVPEGLFNPSIAGVSPLVVPDKQEGEIINLRYAFQNISSRPFADSLVVRSSYRVRGGASYGPFLQKIKPLQPGDTALFDIPTINTLGKGGLLDVQVYVNPNLQPEEYYTNNILDIPIRVQEDRTNPLMEVSFDGVRIMDGDLVSPTPTIQVVLRDENKILLKQDAEGLSLSLKRQCPTCVAQQISTTAPEVKWSPATTTNPFRLEYKPQALENGTYTLTVQGTDAKGNRAGSLDYAINFKVVNESTVTHFFPYPNPFSTSTRFVFTLTGANMPDDLKIQIMTISGRVVREITKDELGPLRIGNNISAYAWDGTDEFGDKLANGVYLYRVQMLSRRGGLEHRATEADDTFKNGFGKLYIMR